MQFGACARSAHALVCILGAALIVGGCQRQPADDNAMSLTPATFSDLPGWYNDAQADALPAWRRSCERIANLAPDIPIDPNSVGGPASAWQPTCARIASLDDGDTEGLRRLIETELVPYHVDNGATGLFTGYFEPELVGSRRPDARHNVPLYRLPDDHLTIDLGDFDPELAGRRLIGRANGARLTPYHERAAIDAGALAGKGAELIWLTDPLDAFILHVQGSGKVLLADGQAVRIGFAGPQWPHLQLHRSGADRRRRAAAGQGVMGRHSRLADRSSRPHARCWVPTRATSSFARSTVTADRRRGRGADAAAQPGGRPTLAPPGHSHMARCGASAAGRRALAAIDDCPGYRFRHQGTGARRLLLGLRRRGAQICRRMSSQGRYFIFLPHAITPPRRVAGR